MAISKPDIIEEQRQQCYTLFERKSKSFRTALISVTALSCIAFVLIFYPYVTFRGSRFVLEAQIVDLDRAIGQLTGTKSELHQLHMDFDQSLRPSALQAIESIDFGKLQDADNRHARELAAIRTNLGEDPELRPWLSGQASNAKMPHSLIRRHPDLAAAGGDPCFFLNRDAWRRCKFVEQLQKLHRKASEPFEYKRISHLCNDLFVPLYDSLDKLHGSFNAWLNGKTTDWRAGDKRASGTLRDHYSFFVQTYQNRLDEHHRFIGEKEQQVDSALYDKGRKRKIVSQQLETVVARLEEMKNLRGIQTPLGQLPVGLNELVLLFPVFLAGGFLLSASLLSETLQLRQAYHRFSRITDPDGTIFNRDHITLIAPVWIDPLKPKLHRVYRMLALALPIIVFFGAIFLLVINRLLWGAFMDEVRLDAIIYVAFYFLSAMSILEGIRRVWRTLRAYDAKA